MRLHYWFFQKTIRAVGRLCLGLKISGTDNVPSGGALIAANHLSNFDPPLFGSSIRREMYFFAKIELFRNRLVGAFLRSVYAYPVRRGEADRAAWRESVGLLQRGKLVLFFPEGTRSITGEIQPAQPGLARLALAAEVPIIPAAVTGSHRIKDCLMRRRKLRVGFGEPIPTEPWRERRHDEQARAELTEIVMREICRLRDEMEQSS